MADTIEEFPEDITASVVMLATDHLFDVSKREVRRKEAEVRAFQRDTIRLLFLYKWSRPDIQTALEFLTTRVKEPMEEYWKKLVRVLASLNGTPEEFLMLSMEDTKLI